MPEIKKLGTGQLLFESAERLGLMPTWIVPNNLFAITTNGRERYVNLTYYAFNSHLAVSLVRNKVLTRLVLGRHDMPNIPFMRPKNQDEAAAFLATFGTIIAKPLKGSGARDIHLIDQPHQIPTEGLTHYILEKYIRGVEMRYLVMNGVVIGVHRSEYGTSVAENRQLERYSLHHQDWPPELVELSIRITAIMGLKFAAIDYLIDATGKHSILEVNSAPGLKWFHAPTAGPAVDVATLIMKAIIDENRAATPGATKPMLSPVHELPT